VALVRVGERRWNLQLKNGITIMLPEGHEAAALARLGTLQTDQALLDRPLVFIDMRLPDRLAVRARPAVPAATPPVTTTGKILPDKITPEKIMSEPAGRRAT
jgi:cell division protein FtsQ